MPDESSATPGQPGMSEERAAEADSVIVKVSGGEIWVPEDCPVPDEMLRAMNAPSRDPREAEPK